MDTLTGAPDIAAPTAVPAAPDQAHPLKLSEAIRLGAMMTEQTFGEFGDESKTCGIGAAQLALGEPVGFSGGLFALLNQSPRVACPQAGHDHSSTVGALIVHLNDGEQMPREKIADWLETIGL